MSDTTKATQLNSNKSNAWFWRFTPKSEILNGRIAMLGFVAAILIEIFSSQGFLHFWKIL